MSGYTYRQTTECHPMQPVDFHRLTPKQRRDLQATRRRQVEAAQHQHLRQLMTGQAATRDAMTALNALIILTASVLPEPGQRCAMPECKRVAFRERMCRTCWNRARYARRRAAA